MAAAAELRIKGGYAQSSVPRDEISATLFCSSDIVSMKLRLTKYKAHENPVSTSIIFHHYHGALRVADNFFCDDSIDQLKVLLLRQLKLRSFCISDFRMIE